MTDKEIVKALKCCASGACAECPRVNNPVNVLMCQGDLICEALDIINRQQAEIERLQKENNQFADIGKMYSEIKSDAIKEFADKVKENRVTLFNYIYSSTGFGKQIDNLVKEMAGDTE